MARYGSIPDRAVYVQIGVLGQEASSRLLSALGAAGGMVAYCAVTGESSLTLTPLVIQTGGLLGCASPRASHIMHGQSDSTVVSGKWLSGRYSGKNKNIASKGDLTADVHHFQHQAQVAIEATGFGPRFVPIFRLIGTAPHRTLTLKTGE